MQTKTMERQPVQDVPQSGDCPEENVEVRHADTILVDPSDSKAVRQTIFRLAGPSLVEMLLINLTQMLNMIMVGRVGAEAVAIVGLSTQPFLLFVALFMALNVGTTVIVARSIGAGDVAQANKAAGQSFALNIVLAVIVVAFSYFFAGELLMLMGASKQVAAEGLLYAKIVFLSIGFTTISMSLTAILRGAGDTRTPMKINVVSNVLIVLLGFPMIYGFAGFPKFGVTGAAISTIIAQAVSMIWVVTVMFSGKYKLRITISEMLHFDKEVVKRILTIGFPSALEQVVMRLGMLTFVKIAASLGTISLAATQIAFNIMGLTFMPGMAFSIAASTLVGQALGAEKPDLAERYGWQVRKFGMIVAGVMGIGFIGLAPYIMMMYTTDQEVIAKGAVGLQIMGFIQVSQATQFILGGALRGAGDTRYPLYSTCIGVWGFRIALSVLMVYVFNWDITGIWLAAAADQFVRSILIYRRYKRGNWKTVRV
ncbi:MATE family efflux transporter [Paenibacillus thalictri]|nr:MATE family efflux transporter [Paenibacillus thalictri]